MILCWYGILIGCSWRLPVANEPLLSNSADPRVIDVCVELLHAGRPLPEIISEAKRLSALKPEMLPTAELEAAEEADGEQTAAAEETVAEPGEQKQSIAVPDRASQKLPAAWLTITATLLGIAAGTAGTVYLPRVMASGSPTEPASASMPFPVPALSPITAAKRDAEPASQTSAETAMLVERGSMFLGSGDLAAAREIYARAVDAGDARAAVYLGTTYDPSFLKRARFAKGVRGDRAAAAYWYRRARDLGSTDAEALLQVVRK